MDRTQRETVVGVFDRRDQAERAVEELRTAGFKDDQIGVAMRGGENSGTMAADAGTNAGGGMATGAVVGGLLGAAAALLIPGIGPVLAIGTLGGTLLAGAAVGAGIGALAGALVGMGVPEDEAKYYDAEFQAGRTIVTVKAGGRYKEAQDVLRRLGGHDIETKGTATKPTMGATSATSTSQPMASNADTMKLREEHLVANKERVQTGEVTIGKEVHEERKTMDVPVTREEVTVERHAVNRPSDTPIGTESRTIKVPVTEERVSLEKQTMVTEEIGIKKEVHQDTQQVSGTVRREEAHIERTGGTQQRSWETEMPTFRQHWQTTYGSQGGRWDEYEPSYRYGFDMANDQRYKGRSWTEVEPEFRKDWSSKNPNQSWDRASNPIKHAWDHLVGAPHTHG